MTLDKLFYSPREVLEMFPEGQRTSLRRLVQTAKKAGCCCKLGRGVSFTPEQIGELQEYIAWHSGSKGIRRNRPTGLSVARLQEGSYIEVRKLLTERKRKNLSKNSKERHSEM